MNLSHAFLAAPPAVMAGLLLAQESIQEPNTRMDPTLFAAAIVTVIAAIGGVIVQVINSMSASRDRRDAALERRVLLEKTNANVDKADTIIEKTAEIHSMTNSTNSNLQKSLELMTEKMRGLEKLISQMQAEKLEIAATRAVTDLQTSAALHSPAPVAMEMTDVASGKSEPTLDKIQKNTVAIEKNTAATDESVNELKDKA